MTLLESCMNGLILASSQQGIGVRPIDFVLSVPSQPYVILVYAEWWTMSWNRGFGFDVCEGELVKAESGWSVVRADGIPVLLSVHESREERQFIERARLRIDVQREAYLDQLQVFRGVLGEDWYNQIDEWIELIKARPVIDPVEAYKKQNTGLRTIGVVTVTDQNDKIVDALVLDEVGNAAATIEDGWLDAIGSQWINYGSDSSRPSLADFLAWVQGQRPSGLNVGVPKIFQSEGSVESIAIRVVPR